MTEIFVSFLVLFAIFSIVVYFARNFQKKPGFEYEQVWSVTLPQNYELTDSIMQFNRALEQSVQSLPKIESTSFTSFNIPFYLGTYERNCSYQGINANSFIQFGEFNYNKVLQLNILEGRWYEKADMALKEKPVVLNTALKEKLFGSEAALGKTVTLMDQPFRVVGIVQDIKSRGDYMAPGYQAFTYMDSDTYRMPYNLLIRVKPGTDAAFEASLYKVLASSLKNVNLQIEHLSNLHDQRNKIALVPVIVMLIVASFLIVNVALGLFGILWHAIQKRKSEIGLRRAVGATHQNIALQMILETFVMSTLALALGLFLTIQFPLLHVFDLPSSVFVYAIVFAMASIYLLTFICALYPGRQAAGIFPAFALHED